MDPSIVYIGLTVGSLITIAILVFLGRKSKSDKILTPMSGIAVGFVLAGLFVGDNILAGYGLMGIGILIALIELRKRRVKRDKPQ